MSSPASFARNIKNLRTAGCDIIVDDVGYFDESPFQDDIIAQAVDDVTADGAMFFSSAGNEGNFDDGLWVQQVINAVELSHHERRWVSLPLDGPAAPAREAT